MARDRNPAKGKPLLRQGTDGNRSREGDISLNSLTEAPVVFSAFAVGETPAPERSEGERGGGRTSPMSKALRKQGAEVLSEKKYPLPVNGLHSGPRVHRIFTLAL
ncbi:MAG: hypothetical protein C4B57_10500 [Deltaproteobacteria bacterium]|nr:MAG: hypothetical protein C4B57_10500 [Deltaproteobacteria bacterium]